MAVTKKVADFMKTKKAKAMAIISTAAIMSLPVTASAAETSGSSSVTYWTISDDLLSPLMTSINTNINAAIPYGLAIMGSFIGISILKRVLYSFF